MNTIVLYAIAIILTVQQGLDYVSTKLVISKGRGSEGNPVMAKWMALSGQYWWTIKLPLVVVIWWLVFTYGPIPMLIGLLAILAMLYAFVIYNNYQIAWRK